jgi:membrane-associated protein
MSGLRYRTFLAWNVLGGIVWGVGYTLLGYVVGLSFQRILTEIGLWSLVVVAIIVAGIVVFEVRRRRREKRRIGTELAGLDGVAGDGASAVPDDEAVPADEEADPADDVDTPAHHEVVPADDMVTPVPADEARPPTPEVGG